VSGHLDDASLRAFASGALEPAALLAADDHLAGCRACSDRAAALLGATAGAGAVAPSGADGVHLTDDGAPAARARRTPWAWLPMAGGVLVAVSLGWLAFGPGARRVAGLAVLTGADRARVEAMLARGRVDLPDVLAEIDGGREVLMGGARSGAFAPIVPVGTVEAEDRPTFGWTALEGARSYRVVIVDPALAPVAESAALNVPTWTPPAPLPRGRTYTWQVTADTAAGPRTTPAPPAPPARFHVLDAAAASRLAAVRGDAPEAHLVLGLLSAEAGLLDAAVRHLSQVEEGSPHAALALDTIAAIEARRRRPASAPAQ
jgi:hypothetical protein